MKKIFLLLVVLITGNVFSQSINVNTTTYTVPQLVNDILINTPCVTATNINWRTGTSFGSTNGIGYFTKNTSAFPMQSGVILSTGDVTQAVGPNTTNQSNGNSSWIGDASLEATLAAAGITMTSKNATVLEFDFVPVSDKFRFKFLFASEEYGNTQCQFSDAFAFLLTNLTAATPPINLAVVPGTATPISVVTVRDNAYNSSCPSVNPQYFGLFNGGSNSVNASTNFNGQTVPMSTDLITLIPGNTYHIKLVIADRNDENFDSAIFLAADSFNIGQEVLGNDLTIANNTAVCANQTSVLNTNLLASDYTFVWKNGSTVIPSQTGPTLTVSTPGTYTVTCTNILTPCKVITDSIIVEYRTILATPDPKNIYKCDNSQPTYAYDLSYNTPIITNGLPSGSTVSYHISQSDADSNLSPLPLLYTSAPNTTIYVRIVNSSTGCTRVKTFQLLVTPHPIVNTILPYHKCAIVATPTKAKFDLATDINPQVLAGQVTPTTQYVIKYYLTLAAANAGGSGITTGITTSTTTVYARIQTTSDSTCYAIMPVSLIVDPIPVVTELDDVVTCNSYTLPSIPNGSYYEGPDGTGATHVAGDIITSTITLYIYSQGTTAAACSSQTSFKVTIVKLSDLAIASGTYCNNYTLPSLDNGEYRDAPSGGGNIIPPGIITTSKTVYFYYSSTIPTPCTVEGSFVINITATQAVANLPNVFECVSYTLPPLTFGNYYNGPNGTGGTIPAGTAITTTKTIHIHGLSGTCPSDSSFKVIIGTSSFPTSQSTCANYTLPTLEVGQYYYGPNGTGGLVNNPVISAQGVTTIYVYVSNTTSIPNCTSNYSFTVTKTLPALTAPTVTNPICDTYTLPALSVGNYFTGSLGTGASLNAGDVLYDSINPQRIYVYYSNGPGCEEETYFDVLVNKTPQADNRGNVEGCNSYVLTPLIHGSYFAQSGGNGVNYQAGDSITTPGANTIYIYANNNGCFVENSFVVTIFNVLVSQPAPVEACNSYILPVLPGTQKYYTLSGGPTVPGNIQKLPGDIITTPGLTTLYIYDESPTRNWCFDEKPLSITIYKTPVITPALPTGSVYACDHYDLNNLIPLTIGKYYTGPQSNPNTTEITDLHLITSQTVYAYEPGGSSSHPCPTEESFVVNIYNVDDLPDPAPVCFDNPYILPPLTVAGSDYYNSAGALLHAGDAISADETITIRGTGGALYSNCIDQTDFDVTVFQVPVINGTPLTITECDDDGSNDGVKSIDLMTLTSGILGSQTGVTATYHASQQEADDNVNPITATTESIAYVRVTNSLAPTSACYKVAPINITINRIPEPTPKDGQFICINSLTNQVIMPVTLNSGLNSLTHTFEWFNSTSTTNIGTSSTLLVIAPDIYSVIATNKATGCKSEKVSVTVNRSESATVSYTVNEDFSEAPILTIIATGVGGDYEYQLDNGPFQDSPTFYNAVSGTHEITVKDKNGCGEITTQVTVINFQRFFTPNEDGSNDIWNISDLKGNSASISIYDRFGKFITRITPSDRGWDGSFNGEKLPADDYWFIVKYKTKEGQNVEYKSHFSLKR